MLFCELLGSFSFFTLPLEIPPLDIPQIFVRSNGNSKAKNQDPWKFHFIFSWSPLQIPHAISLIPLEIPYPQLPCLVFFWNSPTIRTRNKNLRNLPIYLFL